MNQDLVEKGFFTRGKVSEGMGVYTIVQFRNHPYDEEGVKRPIRRLFCQEETGKIFENGTIGMEARDNEGNTTYELVLLLGTSRGLPLKDTSIVIENELSDLNLTSAEIEVFQKEEAQHIKSIENILELEGYEDTEVTKTGYIVSYPYDGQLGERFVSIETKEEFRRNSGDSSGIKMFTGEVGMSDTTSQQVRNAMVIEKLKEENEAHEKEKEEMRKAHKKEREEKEKLMKEKFQWEEEKKKMQQKIQELEEKAMTGKKRKREENDDNADDDYEEEKEEDFEPASKKRKLD